jgi:N-acetylglucosaminyldiphosphoundecaprenol N-acetyl-beta-D-mannosaminyltransferase
MTLERTNILGVEVNAINLDLALETIDRWIAGRHHNYICVTGVHGVIECQGDPELRRIHNQAGLVTPDGMPLVWVSRLKSHRHVDRVYGPDLMSDVCTVSAAKGYRHFLYGGAPGLPERLADQLRKNYPGILIAGTYSPPFRPLTPEEDAAIVERINESEADIVWVGLSTPKQEYWMAAHLGRLESPVMVGVGAARLPGRPQDPGAAMDTAQRPRVVVPLGDGAGPPVATLFQNRAAVPVLHDLGVSRVARSQEPRGSCRLLTGRGAG